MITHLPAFLARSFGIRHLMVISNWSVYISQALRVCFSPDCLLIQTASKDSPRPPIKIVYLWQKWLSTRPFIFAKKDIAAIKYFNLLLNWSQTETFRHASISRPHDGFWNDIMSNVHKTGTHIVIFYQPMTQHSPKRRFVSSNTSKMLTLTGKISLFSPWKLISPRLCGSFKYAHISHLGMCLC